MNVLQGLFPSLLERRLGKGRASILAMYLSFRNIAVDY